MARDKSARAAARRVKDKWRAKEWYNIIAPDIFGNTKIGETISADSDNLIGRKMEITVRELIGDFTKMHIKLKFQIYDVKGTDAHTRFIEQNLTSDYLRRLIRRRHSKTDVRVVAITKDGHEAIIKAIGVAERRIQTSQKSALRKRISEKIEQLTKEMSMGEFVRKIVTGEVQKEITRYCRVVYPLKKVEIRRIEVKKFPEKLQIEMDKKREAEEALKEMEEDVEEEKDEYAEEEKEKEKKEEI